MKTANCESVKIVSFSGIDGAGKTTQIESLMNWLRSAGLSVDLLTFWDDVVVLSRFREGISHKVFKGDKGVGSPEKPLNRRDKNVTSWYVTASRLFLYLLDALSLWQKVRRAKKGDADVVVFDRYVYDELANLPLDRSFARGFISFILRFTPVPDAAYVIDADPSVARARKPEYPLEFIHRNREAYLTLSRLANITVIRPGSIETMQSEIRQTFLRTSPAGGALQPATGASGAVRT
jgi:thymidylate kinase